MFNLEIAKTYMKKNNIDVWLVYDFKECNHVAHEILGQIPMVSRRYFILIENHKDPVLICNVLDKPQFEFCKYKKCFYSKFEELLTCLKKYLINYKKIITEYSPSAVIPTMSILDAGTFELIKEINSELNILSSADCYQLACGSWERISLQKHLDACRQVEEVKDLAFKFIKESLLHEKSVTEFDVQQLILNEFLKRGLITEDVPVVAVNQNSSDPHYEPSETLFKEIKFGDWVLIDLWAKYPDHKAVFSDITWVGYMGKGVPIKYTKVFEIVKEIRDSVVTFLCNNWKNGIIVEGWQADEEARKVARRYNVEQFFIHRTGHSIAPGDMLHSLTVNLDNYETKDTRKILPGIGFSVEPGIYLPEFGVRLEINVYIDEVKGPIVTTEKQKKIITF